METKICSKCGISKPDTFEYYGKGKLYRNGLRPDCKECRAKYDQQRHRANKQKEEQVRQAYRKENRASILANQKRYREENKEQIAQYNKLYRHDSRVQRDTCEQIRRMRMAELPDVFTFQQWEAAKRHFDNRCAYCGKQKPLQQEHYTAVSKGGSYTASNIIPACGSCNSSKGAKNAHEWYSKQKFYSAMRERTIYEYLNQNNADRQTYTEEYATT